MQLFLALLGIVSASPGEPVLVAPEAQVEAGAAAAFTLRAMGEPLSVDGCAALEVERRVGEAWVTVPDVVLCDGSAPAKLVTKDLTFAVASPGAGEYRGVVAWGVGCVPGRAFSQASCTRRGVARSAAFTVAPRSSELQR